MGGEIMKRLKDYENFKMEGYRDPKKFDFIFLFICILIILWRIK